MKEWLGESGFDTSHPTRRLSENNTVPPNSHTYTLSDEEVTSFDALAKVARKLVDDNLLYWKVQLMKQAVAFIDIVSSKRRLSDIVIYSHTIEYDIFQFITAALNSECGERFLVMVSVK